MSFLDIFRSALKSALQAPNIWAAAKYGSVAGIDRLVSEGADVNAWSPDEDGATPLHLASEHGRIEAIRALVGKGAKLDSKDFHGSTPLMAAVGGKRPTETAATLIALGATVSEVGGNGETALGRAAFNKNPELVKLLLEKGAKPNVKKGKRVAGPVADAVTGNSYEVMDLLLNAGASPNTPGLIGNLPLHSAAVYKRVDFVRRLLQAGANPNLQEESDQETALRAAVSGGSAEVVKLLIEAGCDVNMGNRFGQTALDRAMEFKSTRLIPILVAAGATRGQKTPSATMESGDNEAHAEKVEFTSRAASPAFRDVVEELQQATSLKANRWEAVNGGVLLPTSEAEAKDFAEANQARFLARGACVFQTDGGLAALPTTNKYDAIAAVQTNGQNFNIMPGDIIAALKNIESNHELKLLSICSNRLEGEFTLPLKDAGRVAACLIKICPEIGALEDSLIKDLASQLKRDGKFFLWWD